MLLDLLPLQDPPNTAAHGGTSVYIDGLTTYAPTEPLLARLIVEWDVHTSTETNASLEWDVYGTTSSQLPAVWQVRQSVEAQLHFAWQVRSLTTWPLIAMWSVGDPDEWLILDLPPA